MSLAAGPPSAARGALAGLCAAVIAVPVTGIALIVGMFSERALYRKVTGQAISHSEAVNGGQHLLMNAIVAGFAGLAAGVIAGYAAMLLLKGAKREPFIAVAGAGFALIAFGGWRWIGGHFSGAAGVIGFDAAIGWIAGVVGLIVAIMMADEATAA